MVVTLNKSVQIMLENQGKRSFKENPDAKFYKKQMITNNWED